MPLCADFDSCNDENGAAVFVLDPATGDCRRAIIRPKRLDQRSFTYRGRDVVEPCLTHEEREAWARGKLAELADSSR